MPNKVKNTLRVRGREEEESKEGRSREDASLGWVRVWAPPTKEGIFGQQTKQLFFLLCVVENTRSLKSRKKWKEGREEQIG